MIVNNSSDDAIKFEKYIHECSAVFTAALDEDQLTFHMSINLHSIKC